MRPGSSVNTVDFKVALVDWKLPSRGNNSCEVQTKGPGSPSGSVDTVQPAAEDISVVTTSPVRTYCTVGLRRELQDKLPAGPPAVPFRSRVITGFIVITACF